MIANDRRILAIVSLCHSYTHAVLLLYPIIIPSIKGEFSLSYAVVGLLGTVSYALYGFVGIPAGILADRLGSKRMLATGVLGIATFSLVVTLTDNIYTLAISLGFIGLFSSAYHPSGLSLISKGAVERGRLLGWHGVAGSLGEMSGPLLGGWLIYAFGWRGAYLFFGVLGMVIAAAIIILKVEEELKVKMQSTSEVSNNGRHGGLINWMLLIVFVNLVFYGLAYRGAMTFLPVLFEQRIGFLAGRISLVGTLVSLAVGMGMLGQYIGGTLGSRLRVVEVGYVAIYACQALLLLLLGLLGGVPLLVLSFIFGMFLFSSQPLQNLLVAKYASSRYHGATYGIASALAFGMGSFASAISGKVSDLLGVSASYLMLSLVMAPAAILAFILYRRARANSQSS